MAKSPQNAAEKAAEALAAKEAEEAAAKETAQQSATVQEGGEPNPQPDPPTPPPPAAPPAKAESDSEKRVFRCVHNVILAGKFSPPRSRIEITREEHASLFATGSVASAWNDDED